MAEGPNKDSAAEEWEKRLVSGDVPEDFLKVTEPKEDGGAAGAGAAAASDVTANATATLTPVGKTVTSPAPVAAAAAASSTPSVVKTGTLLDLGEDTFPEKDQQTAASAENQGQTPVGRDPDQSTNVTEALTLENADLDNARPMTTEEKDHAMALALQRQLNLEGQEEARAAQAAQQAAQGQYAYAAAAAAAAQAAAAAPPPNAQGRLTVTVAEAKLARNYGMTRMDPYCRVRVGHCVYETPTCSNGAREPKWNKTFNCYLLAGVKAIDVEIYDECTFQADALIAHATFPIPEVVVGPKCEVADDWWPLSGQEGHDKEGMIHLILSMQPIQAASASAATARTTAVRPPAAAAAAGQQVRMPSAAAATVTAADSDSSEQLSLEEAVGGQRPQSAAAVAALQQLPELTEEQLQEFCKMFPNLDKEVITSVYQENRGNQESTVNGLLLLSGT